MQKVKTDLIRRININGISLHLYIMSLRFQMCTDLYSKHFKQCRDSKQTDLNDYFLISKAGYAKCVLNLISDN